MLHLYGPRRSSLGIARAEELLAGGELGRVDEADVLNYAGPLLAMRGDFETAREWVARALSLWRETGTITKKGMDWLGEASLIELLSQDWPAAERNLRAQCAIMDKPGRGHNFATCAAYLAHCLCAQSRDDEAEEWAGRSEAMAPSWDVLTQALWRSARAKVRARAGSGEEAEALAREAVQFAERTDALWERADAYMDLCEVLGYAGRNDEAAAAVKEALRCYEQKELLVGAARARDILQGLREPARPSGGRSAPR
jgi:tetratricopeptide (TPR) repeat protein